MYNTSKYFSYIYADRNVRPCTIQGYTLTTFPNVVQYIYAQPEKQAKEPCIIGGESGHQWRRNQDLPQFSNRHNRCLHCAGDHQTKDCAMTWQWQTLTTNNPASGTGTSTHTNAPNTSHCTSSHSNTQSPASHQHSQSTIHVQTPTLNINAPHFQPNLHQASPTNCTK